MFDRLTKILFDDPTPEQKRYLRRIILPFIVIGHIGWACNWLPLIGIPLSGFAMAGDIEKKINDRVGKVEEEVRETKLVVKGLEGILLDNMTESIQGKIRAQISKRCKTTGAVEREEINREKERLQGLHIKYSGVRYVEPTCAEL